jgi:hypothetical protein
MAMKILSDDTIKPKDIIKLLLNDSLDDDNAAKILKDLLVENFEKAIKVLLKMTEYTLPLKKRAAVLFCELMKNCDDAVEIFLNDAITCNHVCGIFESKHISSVQMANVLITIYTPDTVNKIAEVLRFVCCTSKLRSKVARALRQMDPDKVDSLLDTQFLSPYASAIRSMMEMTTEFKPMTHCYEEEFAVRFHALNAEVEQGESESTDIPQNEAMPADKFPLDENIPSDEIPLADDVDDGEISLETSETPPPSFLEQFREFFKGSADNLLIVAAVAVVSGLALWAVVLWPLAALIGAGCTAVTLSAILLFRNRSANGSKSQEVNPLNFDGNDPFKINGISMVEA